MKFTRGASLWLSAAVMITLLNGCATAIVRNKDTIHPFKTFPATSFDGHLFWHNGIQGKPLFPDNSKNKPTEAKGNFVNSAQICILTLIDMPFSILSDLILLPLDLIHPENHSESEIKKRQGEQGAAANP